MCTFGSKPSLVCCVSDCDECTIRGGVGVATVLYQSFLILHSDVFQEPCLLSDYIVARFITGDSEAM